MAISEYVLLVSLSAGIPAHADTHGISIGPNVITQPNGGAPVTSTRVAALEAYQKPLTIGRVSSQAMSSGKKGSPTTSIKIGNPVRPPAIRTPSFRVK